MAGCNAAATLALIILVITPMSHCALNIETDAPEGMVSELRKSIFIETAYLRQRRPKSCSSLDGPQCLAASLFGAGVGHRPAQPPLDGVGMGVIPETLLRDLGTDEEIGFQTPEYSVLELYRQQLEQLNQQESPPALQDAEDTAAPMRSAQGAVHHGVLHFTGLTPEKRVPLAFSQGLPEKVVATFDGRWIVKECEGDIKESSAMLAPPVQAIGAGAEDSNFAPAFSTAVASASQGGYEHDDGFVGGTAAAELAGSIGYMRFSRPVVVRSILARWRSPSRFAPPAVVGGRLGLQKAWTTHLDPMKLQAARGWVDIGGNPYREVDEIAFLATPGLEVGAVEILSSEDDETHAEKSMLMLVPVDGAQSSPEGAGGAISGQPKQLFTLRLEQLTTALAPYVVSVDEAVKRNLKFGSQSDESTESATDGAAPQRRVPGLLTARSPPMIADLASANWMASAAANEEMFEHRDISGFLVTHAMQTASLPKKGPVVISDLNMAAAANALVHNFGSRVKTMPADLHSALKREHADIVEALLGWASGGGSSDGNKFAGWGTETPATLHQSVSDKAFSNYATAKRWQTKLDILTAAYLHLRAEVHAEIAGGAVAA